METHFPNCSNVEESVTAEVNATSIVSDVHKLEISEIVKRNKIV